MYVSLPDNQSIQSSMDTLMDFKPDEMQAMMSMMEDYLKNSGGNPDPEKAPPHIKKLLEAVGTASQKPQPSEGPQGQDITPSAGFVVKTADEAGRKVFINMCSSKDVPAPANWTYGQVPEAVRKALDVQNEAMSSDQVESALRVPLSCGEAREDMDRQGETCTVVDVIFNDDVLAQSRAFRYLAACWCRSVEAQCCMDRQGETCTVEDMTFCDDMLAPLQPDRPLKNFLISIAMSQTEQKCSIVLDRQWKLPKMRYKGDRIVSQHVRVDSKPRITDLGDVQEEPGFPLTFKKRRAPAQPKPPQPGKPVPAASPVVPAQGPAACQLTPTVQFIGRPVTSVSISVSLGSQRASPQISPADVKAAVCNEDISLQVPGCKLVQVHLPFAVTASGADATISRDGQKLKLHLPLRPCRHMVEQLRQSMPQQLSSLGLASSSHLELEP